MRKRLGDCFALGLGLLGSIGFIYGLERCLEGRLPPPSVVDFNQNRPNYYDAELGYAPPANYEFHHVKQVAGATIYDVWYHADLHRRRLVPDKNPKEHRYYAVFFGDSNMFGEGLYDGQTIPALFSQKLPTFHSYNYAFRGYGTQHVFARLNRGFSPEELEEKSGIGFYIFFDFHIHRVLGSLSITSWSLGEMPYYTLSTEGHPEAHGTFREVFPWRTKIFWYLSQSNIIRYFGLDWPLWVSKGDMALVCALLKESKAKFESMHPKNRFYLVLAGKSGLFPRVKTECLDAEKIPYFELAPMADQKLILYPDFHYNAVGAQWVSDQLVEWARPYLNQSGN